MLRHAQTPEEVLDAAPLNFYVVKVNGAGRRQRRILALRNDCWLNVRALHEKDEQYVGSSANTAGARGLRAGSIDHADADARTRSSSLGGAAETAILDALETHALYSRLQLACVPAGLSGPAPASSAADRGESAASRSSALYDALSRDVLPATAVLGSDAYAVSKRVPLSMVSCVRLDSPSSLRLCVAGDHDFVFLSPLAPLLLRLFQRRMHRLANGTLTLPPLFSAQHTAQAAAMAAAVGADGGFGSLGFAASTRTLPTAAAAAAASAVANGPVLPATAAAAAAVSSGAVGGGALHASLATTAPPSAASLASAAAASVSYFPSAAAASVTGPRRGIRSLGPGTPSTLSASLPPLFSPLSSSSSSSSSSSLATHAVVASAVASAGTSVGAGAGMGPSSYSAASTSGGGYDFGQGTSNTASPPSSSAAAAAAAGSSSPSPTALIPTSSGGVLGFGAAASPHALALHTISDGLFPLDYIAMFTSVLLHDRGTPEERSRRTFLAEKFAPLLSESQKLVAGRRKDWKAGAGDWRSGAGGAASHSSHEPLGLGAPPLPAVAPAARVSLGRVAPAPLSRAAFAAAPGSSTPEAADVPSAAGPAPPRKPSRSWGGLWTPSPLQEGGPEADGAGPSLGPVQLQGLGTPAAAAVAADTAAAPQGDPEADPPLLGGEADCSSHGGVDGVPPDAGASAGLWAYADSSSPSGAEKRGILVSTDSTAGGHKHYARPAARAPSDSSSSETLPTSVAGSSGSSGELAALRRGSGGSDAAQLLTRPSGNTEGHGAHGAVGGTHASAAASLASAAAAASASLLIATGSSSKAAASAADTSAPDMTAGGGAANTGFPTRAEARAAALAAGIAAGYVTLHQPVAHRAAAAGGSIGGDSPPPPTVLPPAVEAIRSSSSGGSSGGDPGSGGGLLSRWFRKGSFGSGGGGGGRKGAAAPGTDSASNSPLASGGGAASPVVASGGNSPLPGRGAGPAGSGIRGGMGAASSSPVAASSPLASTGPARLGRPRSSASPAPLPGPPAAVVLGAMPVGLEGRLGGGGSGSLEQGPGGRGVGADSGPHTPGPNSSSLAAPHAPPPLVPKPLPSPPPPLPSPSPSPRGPGLLASDLPLIAALRRQTRGLADFILTRRAKEIGALLGACVMGLRDPGGKTEQQQVAIAVADPSNPTHPVEGEPEGEPERGPGAPSNNLAVTAASTRAPPSPSIPAASLPQQWVGSTGDDPDQGQQPPLSLLSGAERAFLASTILAEVGRTFWSLPVFSAAAAPLLSSCIDPGTVSGLGAFSRLHGNLGTGSGAGGSRPASAGAVGGRQVSSGAAGAEAPRPRGANASLTAGGKHGGSSGNAATYISGTPGGSNVSAAVVTVHGKVARGGSVHLLPSGVLDLPPAMGHAPSNGGRGEEEEAGGGAEDDLDAFLEAASQPHYPISQGPLAPSSRPRPFSPVVSSFQRSFGACCPLDRLLSFVAAARSARHLRDGGAPPTSGGPPAPDAAAFSGDDLLAVFVAVLVQSGEPLQEVAAYGQLLAGVAATCLDDHYFAASAATAIDAPQAQASSASPTAGQGVLALGTTAELPGSRGFAAETDYLLTALEAALAHVSTLAAAPPSGASAGRGGAASLPQR